MFGNLGTKCLKISGGGFIALGVAGRWSVGREAYEREVYGRRGAISHPFWEEPAALSDGCTEAPPGMSSEWAMSK